MIKKIARKIFPNFYTKLGKVKRSIVARKLKKEHPNTKIFHDNHIKLYSQHNQDYIVYNNFFKNKKGVFCDVGGNHPLNINNTLYFEEIGWEGLAFEPLPSMKPLWEKHRKAKFFSFGVSDKENEVAFSVVKDVTGWENMLSFVKSTGKQNLDLETQDIIIQVKPLKDIFEREGITHIDYMSIDIEGHELNALKGIDFNKVRINVLTIEVSTFANSIQEIEEIRQLMRENDYILWGIIVGLDDIYVHKNFLN